MSLFDQTQNKVKVTTTVHPEFLAWLKEQNMTLAAWIEYSYEHQHEVTENSELRGRLDAWMKLAYKQRDELTALKFRVDLLEQKAREKVPGPSKRKDKHGGVI